MEAGPRCSNQSSGVYEHLGYANHRLGMYVHMATDVIVTSQRHDREVRVSSQYENIELYVIMVDEGLCCQRLSVRTVLADPGPPRYTFPSP